VACIVFTQLKYARDNEISEPKRAVSFDQFRVNFTFSENSIGPATSLRIFFILKIKCFDLERVPNKVSSLTLKSTWNFK